MRGWMWCGIGLLFTLLGCSSQERSSQESTETSAPPAKCATGDCCSSVNRAAMLAKSQKPTQGAAQEETKRP